MSGLALAKPGNYRGRFAPTPSGPLHAGSVVAALASWLDARAHRGTWLVRIEDIDGPRCIPGADRHILRQLATLGLQSDEPVQWQSRRTEAYGHALQRLARRGWAYPCRCSRKAVEAELDRLGVPRHRHAMAVYPGTCRPPRWTAHTDDVQAVAWRLRADAPRSAGPVRWVDRRLGPQQQHLEQAVGDFVIRRADGLWAYQLAVVVDDALQGITHVVRGEDLADNTPRQIHLCRHLGLAVPAYLHTPLVLAADGQKLSKQNGAEPISLDDPLAALAQAARMLELEVPQVPARSDPELPHPSCSERVARWLEQAIPAWGRRWLER